jgi:hypothetical protein
METQATDAVEWLVHRILFWETDNKRKGRVLRAVHTFGTYALLTLIVVSHIVYPAFWLQTLIFFFCFCVWTQHILTHGCVLSKVEQRLLEDEVSFMDPYLELFRIETDNESKKGLLTLGSTIATAMLGLEWLARVHYKVRALVASSAVHIPLPSSSLLI